MDGSIERLATITDHLVGFPTTADNAEAIHGCIDWVRAHLLARSPRLTVQRFIWHDKPSLLFTAGKNLPRVLFCGHLDVVEAPRQDDFRATPLDETRLRGRGTADMKGPVAALIDIMATEPQTGLGLLLTTDEEIGGEDGVGHFLENVGWRPDVVVMPDGGANMRLVTEQKGILRLRIVSGGKPVHSSRPWLGENAIEVLWRGYQALLRAYPTPADEEDWRVSIALTELHGGITPNTVPWQAEATLDIRFPGSITTGPQLFTAISRRLARYGITAHMVVHIPPFSIDPDAPQIDRLQAIARAMRLGPLPLVREAGASDARYFSQLGVPVLMFQPDCFGWHGTDEWVDLASLASFRALCAHTMRSMLARLARPTSLASKSSASIDTDAPAAMSAAAYR
jgi:succinyl-diaminopimelate desuccinylase